MRKVILGKIPVESTHSHTETETETDTDRESEMENHTLCKFV